MEAHERFSYDETAGVQKLRDLVWLCWACHPMSHFGLAKPRAEAEGVLAHLQFVTGMSRATTRGAGDPGFGVAEQRNRVKQTVDLSVIPMPGSQSASRAGRQFEASCRLRTRPHVAAAARWPTAAWETGLRAFQ
jgi:hypothetical protein